ncbi:MAG: pentapeptide repeat-containing protein [Candidatus Coatesbacteria bacterium]|nr:pentapeptide repeat-containing protein [Candidatus Coatesbacteria bacterium]
MAEDKDEEARNETPDEEKPPGYYRPNDPDARPGIDWCEECAVLDDFPWERKSPIYLKTACWKHLPQEERNGCKQLIEQHKSELAGKNLSYARLEGSDLTFAGLSSTILERATLDGAMIHHSDLRNADLRFASLKGAKLWDSNLEGANFTGANIDGANLYNTEKPNLGGPANQTRYTIWVMLRDGFRKKNNRVRITHWDSVNGAHTAQTDSIAQRYIKDAAYIEDFRKQKKIRAFFWRWSCFYGQSFLLWAFWCVLIAFGFACLYDWREFLTEGTETIKDFGECFYFSIVAFTTLGFGDVYPNPGWGQFCAATEVILGYIGLGGLISILANKVARRA